MAGSSQIKKSILSVELPFVRLQATFWCSKCLVEYGASFFCYSVWDVQLKDPGGNWYLVGDSKLRIYTLNSTTFHLHRDQVETTAERCVKLDGNSQD